MSDQDVMGNAESTNPEEVMETLGEPAGSAEDINNPTTLEGTSNSTNSKVDPLYVQKRLKQQGRQHEREMRDMQAQMACMHEQLNNLPSQGQNTDANNPCSDDPIQKAVHFALAQRDLQERKQKEAENQAHLQKRYRGLQSHLDDMGDKYDDFHNTVLNNDAPYSPTMRDYALTLPTKGAGSAGEVLYHLGKHPDELKRISKLHPLDQTTEMAKLSHALISGGENKASPSRKEPLGNIKTRPISNSDSVNDKTPISSLRARMLAGKW